MHNAYYTRPFPLQMGACGGFYEKSVKTSLWSPFVNSHILFIWLVSHPVTFAVMGWCLMIVSAKFLYSDLVLLDSPAQPLWAWSVGHIIFWRCQYRFFQGFYSNIRPASHSMPGAFWPRRQRKQCCLKILNRKSEHNNKKSNVIFLK